VIIARQLLLFVIVTVVISACSIKITEDQLIGGTWSVTNGYENGEIGGDPICPSFDEGMEFIDNEKVYVISEEKEFTYKLREFDEGMEISFFNPNGIIDFYKITMENENAFGLNSSGVTKTWNCYFEHQN